MAKQVIIFIPEPGRDSAHGTVRWVQTDDRGELLGEVRETSLAEAAVANEGRRITVVIPGSRVLLAEATVPGGSAARAQQAIPYALEDQVADDVEELHFALGSKGADDHWPVAIVSRELMDQMSHEFAQAGLRPSAVVPETLVLPRASRENSEGPAWSALADGRQVVVRLDEYSGFAAEQGMGAMLLDSARQAVPEEQTPQLALYHTRGASPLKVPVGIEFEVQPAQSRLHLYAQGLRAGSVINLLQGDYSPRSQFDRTWKPWRITAVLAVCVVGALLAGRWVDYFRLKSQERQLDAAIATVFERALPGEKLTRPRRQMSDRLAGASGGNPDGFTARLYQISSSLATQSQTEVRSLAWRDGRFELDINTDALPTLDALGNALSQRGDLELSVQSANNEDGGVRARVRIE